MLIPGELLEHPGPAARLDPDRAAAALGLPVGELRLALMHAPLEAPARDIRASDPRAGGRAR